jgi:glycerol kinase
MTDLVLSIDVGTHAARAAVVEPATAKVHLVASRAIQLKRIDKTHVEQNPGEIIAATHSVIQQVLEEAITAGLLPASAALATQRSTVLAWDRRSGEALSPALSWQDTRAAVQVQRLYSHRADVKARSGLVLSPHYGASKLRWLLEQQLEQQLEQTDTNWRAADVCLGPLASYLLFHLLQDHPCVCDEGNASRTQLWNLTERVWDNRLCELFSVPREFLPEVRPIQANYGYLSANDGGAGFKLPLLAVCGDQNAAFYAFTKAVPDKPSPTAGTGWALINAGTGAFVLSPLVGDMNAAGELLVGPYRSAEPGNRGGQSDVDMLVEGTVNGAGSALDWCYDNCRDRESITRDQFYQLLPDWLKTPPFALFVNSIGGLGSPWWRTPGDPHFVTINGNSKSLTLPQKASAVLESIVFLINANIQSIEASQPHLDYLVLTGGFARFDAFCQKLANLVRRPVLRPEEVEATLLGAAALAQPVSNARADWHYHRFQPQADPLLHQRYDSFVDHLNQLLISATTDS